MRIQSTIVSMASVLVFAGAAQAAVSGFSAIAISCAACGSMATAGFVNTVQPQNKPLFADNYAMPLLTLKVAGPTFNTQFKRPSTVMNYQQSNRFPFAQDLSQSNEEESVLPNNLSTNSIPTPGAIAFFGLAGLVNSRRRSN